MWSSNIYYIFALNCSLLLLIECTFGVFESLSPSSQIHVSRELWKRDLADESVRSIELSSMEDPENSEEASGRAAPKSWGELRGDASIYQHVNWGTRASQYRNRTFMLGFTYFGFYGNCEKKETHFRRFKESNSYQSTVLHFAKLMRVDCRPDKKVSLENLFVQNLINLNMDQTISVNFESPILKPGNKDVRDRDKIYMAFYLSFLSHVYASMMLFPVAPNTPDGRAVSDHVFVLMNVMLGMLDIANQKFPHFIGQFCENFLISANNIFPGMVDRSYIVSLHTRYTAYQKARTLGDLLMVGIMREFAILRMKGIPDKLDSHEEFKLYYIKRKDEFIKELQSIYSWIDLNSMNY